MGINGCSKIVWTAKNLRPGEIINLIEKAYDKSTQIRLDVDVMCLYHSFRQEGHDYETTLKNIAQRMIVLSTYGFNVTGVVDGETRPDCKRASWDRKKKKLFSNMNSIFCWQKALSLAASIDQAEKMSDEEKYKKWNLVEELNSDYDK